MFRKKKPSNQTSFSQHFPSIETKKGTQTESGSEKLQDDEKNKTIIVQFNARMGIINLSDKKW